MSDFPEITTEQIMARLRMIVAEPESLCKTDFHYIEDAADEIELLRSTVTDCRIEIERLRADVMCLKYQNAEFVRNLTMAQDERNAAIAERDEARVEVCYFRGGKYYEGGVSMTRDRARVVAKGRGWDCFKDDDDGNPHQ